MSNPHKGQPMATRGRPLEESRGVAVMMHGRGRDTEDILSVAERIDEEYFAYLAPAAKKILREVASGKEADGWAR